MGNKKIGKAVHLTAAIVFAVLAVIAFALYVSMLAGFFTAFAERSTGAQDAGAGLSLAISLVFMLVFGFCNLVLSGVGQVLSFTVVKFTEGKSRLTGIIVTVAHIVMVAVCVVGTLVALILSKL